MKAILIMLISLGFFRNCDQKTVVNSSAPAGKPADTIDFTKHIQPIFVARCSPCHFTGGKMYQKMPFDSASTILSHETGIMRRIKDEKEKSLLIGFYNKHR